MDPVSVLGLVASITGIVSFGSKTVKIAFQIRHAGSYDEILSLERCADDMTKAARLLRSQSSSQTGNASGSDQDILLLADHSLKIADKIVKLSEDVKGARKDGKTPGKWSAVQQALKVILSGDRIKSLEKELDWIRGLLQLQSAGLINERIEAHSIQLDDALKLLDKNAASFLLGGTVLDDLRGTADTIIENQSRGEVLAEARHAEVIRHLAAQRHPDSVAQFQCLEPALETPEQASQLDQIAAQRTLDWLWLPNMSEREDAITEAFDQTLEWVFCDPKKHDKPWDNFSNFLRSAEARQYWITGKPGCGKSTLMKFIAKNTQTKDHLQTWSRGDSVLIAKYYFSHRAPDIHKSPAAMLRSLLHQILRQRPDWVKDAFSESYQQIFRRWGSDSVVTALDPSEHQLREGLKNLVQGKASSRFFLMIDGLDECKGTEADMEVLVNTLIFFAQHTNVKVLVSSRPWLVFEEIFHESQRLRVHELTRRDILHFTKTQIMNHPRARILQGNDPAMISNFTTEIAEASSGVFLWVFLVVRSLLQGLRNYDTVQDLRARLHELPTELHDFFYLMWTQVPGRYRAQASTLLQLVEAGTKNGSKISLLGLNFAQEDKDYAQKIDIKPLPDDELGARIETTRTHLLTRCLGLVEVLHIAPENGASQTSPRQPRNTGTPSQPIQVGIGDMYQTSSAEASRGYPNAAFIHKTVYEFLAVPEIRRELEHCSSPTAADTASFSPAACLLRSALVKIKIFHFVHKWDGLGRFLPHGLAHLLELFFALARETERMTGLGQTCLLEELDRAMSCHQQASARPTIHWLNCLPYDRELVGGGRRVLMKQNQPVNDLLALCVNQQLVHTFKDMVVQNGPERLGRSSRDRLLLIDAFFRTYYVRPENLKFDPKSEWYLPRFEVVKLLLEFFPEPNDSAEIVTDLEGDQKLCVWNIYADTVFRTNKRPDPRAVETFLRAFTLFPEYHTTYKSTTADLDSIRYLFQSFLKDRGREADSRLSKFCREVEEAMGSIDELQVKWAHQEQQAAADAMVKGQQKTADVTDRSRRVRTPFPPWLLQRMKGHIEVSPVPKAAALLPDRIRKWFHQRRHQVPAPPKSDSKPHI